MEKWIGSKVSFLLVIAAIAAMVVTSAAVRSEFSDLSKEQQLILLSNILLKGARGGVIDDNSLSACIPQGQICTAHDTCCPGYLCQIAGGLYGSCVWCPRAGDPCGMMHSCCAGLACDGWVNGKCH